MMSCISKILPFAFLVINPFYLNAEIYKDANNNYAMVASNGDKVVITPSSKVIYNGSVVAQCSGKNQVFTYENAIISCRGRNISLTAKAVFSLQDGKLSIVDGSKIETKHLSSVKKRIGRGTSISIIEHNRENIRNNNIGIIIEDSEELLSIDNNKNNIHSNSSSEKIIVESNKQHTETTNIIINSGNQR